MQILSHFYHRLLDALAAAAGLLILAAMLGVAADVFARYAFGRPIIWMFEVTEYALLYIPCLGIAWLARERGHVAITTFTEALPMRTQRVLAFVTTAGCSAACVIVAYWGSVVLIDRFTRGTVSAQMIRVPEYLLYWVIPFGFGLAAVEFARLAVTAPLDPRPAAEH